MKVDTNLWGVVLILDHNEVGTLKVNTAAITGTITGVGAGSLTAVLAAAGVSAPIVTVVVAGVAAAIAVNLALIQEVDKGNGTYITIPWPAIFAAAPVLIPTTAPAATPPPAPDWAGGANGAFGTTDQADRISFSIEHNVAPFTLVTFKLAIAPSSSGTWKSIQLPDNRVIQSTGWGTTAEGMSISFLYTGHPEARIVFSKPGVWGIHHPVLQLGGLNLLQNRDRVTFTWEAD